MTEEKDTTIDFGGYAILDGIEHYFEKLPDVYWKIATVTSGKELERSKFMLHNRVIETRDGIRRELPPSWLEVAYREIALTFGGTNMQDRSGEPVLNDDASIPQIESFLARMPQDMVLELWKAIGKAYPKWGPADPNAL